MLLCSKKHEVNCMGVLGRHELRQLTRFYSNAYSQSIDATTSTLRITSTQQRCMAKQCHRATTRHTTTSLTQTNALNTSKTTKTQSHQESRQLRTITKPKPYNKGMPRPSVVYKDAMAPSNNDARQQSLWPDSALFSGVY